MELRHLKYFVAVAEELHFGRAAARLHVVQPAVSKQVSNLEKELGVRLFRRTKREVLLTDAGTVLYKDARRILGESERAAETARRAGRGQIGRLTVGFIGPAIYGILPLILRTYRERFPSVEMDLHEWTTTEQVKRLHSGFLDIGFVRLPVDDEEFLLERVFWEPVAVALPREHPLAENEKVPLEMLANESFIMIPRWREPGLYDHYITLCRQAGFSPQVVQETHRIQTSVGLVASGMGVAFVPASTRKLKRPEVVYRGLKGSFADLEMAIAWRRDDATAVLREFREVVAEIAPQSLGP